MLNPVPFLDAVSRLLERRSRWYVILGSIFSVFALGVVDYATGPDLAFSVFYLIPVSIVAWKESGGLAVNVAALSALTWLQADLLAGATYSHWLVPAWNTTSRFAVFTIVAGLIDTLHSSFVEQQNLARIDPLTGVANPRSFKEDLVAALEEMRREPLPLTFVYVDLDDFKTVNDTLGHTGGDRLLQSIGTALTNVTRGDDRVARLGGDEFALLLPDTHSEGARQLMQVLSKRLRAELGAISPSVSFSAGAVTFLVPPHDVDDMINKADELMYEAKRGGKATCRHLTVGAGMPGAVADHSSRRARKPRAQVPA